LFVAVAVARHASDGHALRYCPRDRHDFVSS
jgi:hypothetical protein